MDDTRAKKQSTFFKRQRKKLRRRGTRIPATEAHLPVRDNGEGWRAAQQMDFLWSRQGCPV